MKRIVSLLLVLVLVFSLTACKKNDAKNDVYDNNTGNTGNNGDVSSEPDSAANTLTFGTIELSGTFSPIYYSSSYDGYVVDLVMHGLVTRDEEGLIVPAVATKWEVSEDNLTYTFYLNPDVKFSDGTPVTAKDVEFTFKAIAHPNYDGRYGALVQDIVGADEYTAGTADTISGINIIDDHTISFTHKNVMRANVENFTVAIMSVNYYGENGDVSIEKIKSLNEKPFGCGPYMVKEYVPQQFMSLTKNPNYYGDGYQIKNVVLKVVTDVTELDELLTGNIDMLAGQIIPEKIQAAKDTGNFTLIQYPRSGYGYIRFNTRSEFMSDVRVRQALAYAFNKEKFVQDMFQGLAVTQATPMSQVSWAYTDELVSKLNPYAYDPAKANALLDEAGWVKGSDGIRVKDGKRLVINFPAMPEHSVLDVLVPTLIEQYKEVGIELNTTYLDFNSIVQMIYSEDDNWDMFFLAASVPTADPDSAYSEWHSKFIGAGMDNVSKFNDPINDQLLDEGRREFDVEKAKKIYEDWAINLNEKMPIIIVYANLYTDIVSNRIQGMKVTSLYPWTSGLKYATITQ